jgi:phage terminase large subunit-like protein
MFWYFYPDQGTVNREAVAKWEAEWLPREDQQSSETYGWKWIKENGDYKGIKFKSGVTLYFQTYTKKAATVQASTVHEIFADEELPVVFYDELILRLTVTNGIFNAGFTPTLNEFFWSEVMDGERLPSAFKQTISMYDSLSYEDGTKSTVFSIEKINDIISKCKDEHEVQRRVYGKSAQRGGRSFYGFDRDKHIVKPYDIKGWNIYSGVDYGSGGKNHPSAILFLALRDDCRKGVVFRGWRGDDQVTTAGDTLNKYIDMAKDLKISQACYDPASVDFGVIATRNGVGFTKAIKKREVGQELVNTLFHHGMLDIFSGDDELEKLAWELDYAVEKMQKSSNKKFDDMLDALRYVSMIVPWDLSVIDEYTPTVEAKKIEERKLTFEEEQIMMRRGLDVDKRRGDHGNDWNELEEDFEYWNDQYG